MDANLLHISYEGRVLEDPAVEAGRVMWRWTVSPEKAPDRPSTSSWNTATAISSRVNGRKMTPARVLDDAERDWRASTASAASTWSRTATSA